MSRRVLRVCGNCCTVRYGTRFIDRGHARVAHEGGGGNPVHDGAGGAARQRLRQLVRHVEHRRDGVRAPERRHAVRLYDEAEAGQVRRGRAVRLLGQAVGPHQWGCQASFLAVLWRKGIPFFCGIIVLLFVGSLYLFCGVLGPFLWGPCTFLWGHCTFFVGSLYLFVGLLYLFVGLWYLFCGILVPFCGVLVFFPFLFFGGRGWG